MRHVCIWVNISDVKLRPNGVIFGGYRCDYPCTETSNDIALRIANVLNKPYRQGFVKNRYVGRTFIMPGQTQRRNSVRRKLNTISSEFKGKNVLLVDDSIVRGTTSEQIVEMARAAGAKKVYFASAAPEIRYPNVYGIDMPTSHELIAYGRTVDEIAKLIGVDKLIYQDLSALEESVRQENPAIESLMLRCLPVNISLAILHRNI